MMAIKTKQIKKLTRNTRDVFYLPAVGRIMVAFLIPRICEMCYMARGIRVVHGIKVTKIPYFMFIQAKVIIRDFIVEEGSGRVDVR